MAYYLQSKTAKKSVKFPLYATALGSKADELPVYISHKVSSNDGYAGLLSNPKLYKNRTYYVKVLFRPRGDGNSTPSKCSSIGFIAYWDNWNKSRSYIHYSDKAYSERGHFVSWTYSFTVSEDVQPTGTAIYFIIDNYWAIGADDQTIDLYYCKYWDSEGNIYNEMGMDVDILEVEDKKTSKVYATPLIPYNLNNTSNIKVKGKYYPTTYSLFNSNSATLPGSLNMSPGNFSTSAGQIKSWVSDGFYILNFNIKDNYVREESSCHYYKEHVEYYGPNNQYTRVVVDFDYRVNYGNSADSNIYIYKNGNCLNSSNYDLDLGDNFKVYVKPGDVVAIKHVYRGDGIVVTVKNSVLREEEVKDLIKSGNGAYGYIKESGNSSYAMDGFGKGKANSSTISFSKEVPQGSSEFSKCLNS